MADQNHWNENDCVGEQDRHDRLIPTHACANQIGREQIRWDTDHHTDPERGDGNPVPCTSYCSGWQLIFVVKITVDSDEFLMDNTKLVRDDIPG